MAADLLACPHCGSLDVDVCAAEYGPNAPLCVICASCQARGPKCNTTADAKAAWAMRTKPLAAPAPTTGERVYGPTAEDRARLRDAPAFATPPAASAGQGE